MRRGEWSKEDEQYLIDTYKSTNIQECCEKLNRDKQSIQNKAKKLKITKPKVNKHTHEYIKEYLLSKNLILLEQYTHSHNKHKIKCYCGKVFKTTIKLILSGNTRSCGCHFSKIISDRSRKSLLNQKFERLLVIDFASVDKHQKCVWKCKCDCGKIKNVNGGALIQGETKSCGCLQKDIMHNMHFIDITNNQQKFGKLTAKKYLYSKKNNNIWKCLCKCGKFTKISYSHFVSEHIKSCGNCCEYRNGIKTSFIALDLHQKLIEAGYPTQDKYHNYKTKSGYYIDIALSSLKIAIEYDGWYYHKKYKKKNDIKRSKQLRKEGWKILRIRSKALLPKMSTINIRIEKLKNNSNYEVITCKDWY